MLVVMHRLQRYLSLNHGANYGLSEHASYELH